ncbi:hypothetical protein L1049_024098 [Liquidambar formosana]|uniref:F-box protein At3g26010-like beta-propeller domain-containing protein n=1 Tax=Liquidambar formosana TaxID=63359 RepID=A0AAP0WZ99_LIQFO
MFKRANYVMLSLIKPSSNCRIMEEFQEEFQNNDMEYDNDDMTDTEDLSEGIDSCTLEPALTNGEEFVRCGRYQFKTAAYVDEDKNAFTFPRYIRREDAVIEDVIRDSALPFLPAKSLVRFKTICKGWNEWISRPLFAHRQAYSFRGMSGLFSQLSNGDPSFISLNRMVYGIPKPPLNFLPEPVQIISTCNGLLFSQGHDDDNAYYICNPATKDWKRLPKPSLYHVSGPAAVLAFEPSRRIGVEYFLVRAVDLVYQPVIQFEVYSSTEGSWKVSDSIYYYDKEILIHGSVGFYMKGITYWEISPGKALAFDLKEDLCGVQPLPSCSWPRGVLTEMHGELCYVRAYRQGNECKIDIYGDIDMKLKRTIHLNPPDAGESSWGFQALPCLNSELLIILVGKRIYSYHVKDQKLALINSAGNNDMRYLPYVNSLVSLSC